MLIKRTVVVVLTAMLLPLLSLAQVTTSSITGTVKTTTGEGLEGATITATHTPSGTVYNTISKKGGTFNLPNVRIGGPYSLKVEFVGYKPATAEGFELLLGQPYTLNLVMGESIRELGEVVVTGTGTRRTAAADKTGTATNITSRQLTTLPTVSRSITDFTRLTPQASGTSFGGRDGRYNNVQVDGANLNNNFGLNDDLLPGGGNPISLDAIEEISVNIAPYDVRQGNFTGAGISAVTKSGTNTFKGSAYTYYRDETFNGYRVKDSLLRKANPTHNNVYGGTLGGPIIKNKLFFFFSGEYEERPATLSYFNPTGGTGGGNVSDVPYDSLAKLANYLKTKYDYDPGQFDNFQSNSTVSTTKLLGKIDWNINKNNKLILKYSDYSNTSESLPSQSGGINGASSQGSIITYGPKFSKTAMAFSGTTYATTNSVKSGTFELNSSYNGKFANQLLGTYTKISATKDHPGKQFPFVDIIGLTAGSKNNYMSFGNEPFNGNNNIVLNDIYNITDNFTYFTGKHTLTGGATYEYQRVGNMFMPGSQGYYVFGSLDDFINNRAPKLFSISYSLDSTQESVYSAELKIGQLGLYAQDEYNINSKLKITAGIRADKPIYLEQPRENKGISNLPLYDKDGNIVKYNSGSFPKTSFYLSPRVGIRWDVYGDKKLIVRGGTGIFTGRIPFVYLTNQPSTSGVIQFGPLITNSTDLQNFKFNPDAHAYNPFYNKNLNRSQFPTTAGTVPTGAYALIAPNYKFPQVFRTNVGIDRRFGKGWTAGVEVLYTKDLNATYMYNANQKAPDTVVVIGPTVRGRYSSSGARKLNSTSGNAIVLDNTGRGGSFVFTAQVSKSFAKGLYASLAYNYTLALDVTANPGSQAGSVWSVNPTSGTQNDVELSYSNFATPHRLVGTVSYRKEYFKHFATTASLFYEGSNPVTYSYIYNGDVNNDGNSADLMYIPKDASEIIFVPLAASGSTPAFTAQQQSDAFFKFIDQDKYLSKHKGQVAERFGARLPWYNRVDFKLTQDIFHDILGHKTTLQLTADVLNFLNMLNRDWGVRQQTVVTNPLKFVSYSGGKPTFTLATANGKLIDKTFQDNYSTSSTWGAQVGLKLIF